MNKIQLKKNIPPAFLFEITLSLIAVLFLFNNPPVGKIEATKEKVNICHRTNSPVNRWDAIRVDARGWNGHDQHQCDFVYKGPTKPNGQPLSDDWCYENELPECGDCYPKCRPTLTPTPTSTPSPTLTPTLTPTPTPTPIIEVPLTPTFTPTPTPTELTPTPTPEVQPTITPILSPIPSPTPTPEVPPAEVSPAAGGPGEPFRCDATVPPAPTLLTVNRLSGSEVSLNWTVVSPLTHYSISYGLSSKNYIYGVFNTGNTSSYVIGGLQAGVNYCFAVKAVNDCAPSELSNEICTGGTGAVLGVTTGKVLGVSTLGATGGFNEQIGQILFIIGCVCLSCGLRLFTPCLFAKKLV